MKEEKLDKIISLLNEANKTLLEATYLLKFLTGEEIKRKHTKNEPKD